MKIFEVKMKSGTTVRKAASIMGENDKSGACKQHTLCCDPQ